MLSIEKQKTANGSSEKILLDVYSIDRAKVVVVVVIIIIIIIIIITIIIIIIIIIITTTA